MRLSERIRPRFFAALLACAGILGGIHVGSCAAAPGGPHIPQEPIERHPTLEAPDEVAVDQEFAVQLSLTEGKVTPGVDVLHGERSPDGRLRMRLPPPPGGAAAWDLDVVLSAPDFAARGGANTARIRLPFQGDSTPALFYLRAKAFEGTRRDARLFATLWHDGAYLARIARAVTVLNGPLPEAGTRADGTAATRAPQPPHQAQGRRAQLQLSVKAPDLTVYFAVHSAVTRGRNEAELILISPHVSPSTRTFTVPVAPGLREFLDSWYARLGMASVRGESLVSGTASAPAPHDRAERNVAVLRGLGRQLWQGFAPEPFRDMVWRLRDLLGDRFRSIQVITDDPARPWELMRPARGDVELDFLGATFQVARWHLTEGAAPLDRPPQQMCLQRITAVAPRYTGSRALPGQALEKLAVADVGGASCLLAGGTLDAFRSLLGNPPRGIVHFAGHGVVRMLPGGVPEYAIALEDGELDLTTWRGLGPVRGAEHPVFFFNACDVGAAHQVAGFVDGWAPAVLNAGASGYIGGLWPLGDAGAAEFAAAFYRALADRLRLVGEAEVAEILRVVRRRFAETGDPTMLAYVYYGDPLFRFTEQ